MLKTEATMKRRILRSARWFAALLPVVCACCGDDPAPADAVADIAADIAPETAVDADQGDADAGDDADAGGDADAAEATADVQTVITHCDPPDGGLTPAMLRRGGNTTQA